MSTNNFFEKKQPWSKVKDTVVAGYLKPYCAKLLATKKPLKIVDCFAGKGKFEDGDDGSPLMIAKVIKEILHNQQAYDNKDIEACFIEKKYHDDLKTNLLPYYNYKVINGKFEDNISKIIEKNQKSEVNLFLYIDPYGIKSLSFEIFNELDRMDNISTEFLMNFNSFGFLREGFRLLKYTIPDELNEVTFESDEKNSIEKMNIIANGDYWQKIVSDKNDNAINMYKAEQLFVERYIVELKKVYKYVVNIPIKEKLIHLPKYHLIFGSNHHDGVKLMVDNMNKVWNNSASVNMSNMFDIFESPNYYSSLEYNLEDEILKLSQSKIHLKELLLKLIDIFGIAYNYSEYIDVLKKFSKVPESLFDNNEQRLRVIREYKTNKGKEASDWNWDNEIYIESL